MLTGGSNNNSSINGNGNDNGKGVNPFESSNSEGFNLSNIPNSMKEPIYPQYANIFNVTMNGSGPNEGETTIEFRQAFRKSTMDLSGLPADPNGIANKLVGYICLPKNVAIELRDALDAVITQSEFNRN